MQSDVGSEPAGVTGMPADKRSCPFARGPGLDSTQTDVCWGGRCALWVNERRECLLQCLPFFLQAQTELAQMQQQTQAMVTAMFAQMRSEQQAGSGIVTAAGAVPRNDS